MSKPKLLLLAGTIGAIGGLIFTVSLPWLMGY
jgi:hypothetical protein